MTLTQQDPRLPAAELRGVLDAAREQQQRRDARRAPRARRAAVASRQRFSGASVHEYHSLLRFQPSDQKISSAQRVGQAAAAHAGAHADLVAAVGIELRLDHHRPALDGAGGRERLVELGEDLLAAERGIAQHVALADRMPGQFAPQRDVDQVGVEPEAAPLAHDGLQLEVDVTPSSSAVRISGRAG